uniref:O-acetyl-ADP-ribose deacetylase (Regulator of RNase III), contains Macro domain n=1 Tax=Candidatus Kentrum sp. SD TaxID=2126332 RepID=A0A451BM29_9GAMM|nr:MAG: O-acetyl-ADP-ribose deacetylase (regulator of RNase III), contains Macro domain [Candidatus Kentron sp. SD]VFK45156.1 MAG: O-acetyl-ADP-ribose deacetylase (regulator of RNase III), contains Macro domain [Candidatus Kentron sp. SD]VFK79361.1 MAG: O-acetyl-ADP-ribose deacetylase (regulator of RNase III), contains Macro domain [Candidatus Kentron sp. SD]
MITIIVGDITKLDVEAIVNAANTTLLGGGGVDGAIHRAAGPGLKEDCRRIGCCPTGSAEVTPGFRLPAKWVIHTVGPVWSGGNAGEPKLLANCYRNTLELALQRDIPRIAFPAISTGVYGYPKPDAARIALGIIREYEDRFREIIICCFREEDAAIYRHVATDSRKAS